jgi:NAD(P)-dependent dehydrogenase (short-subunit alcohol dehydrogenase family)
MVFETHRGRVAVVTGAARGFGMAICRQLAARSAKVVAVDRDEPTETVVIFPRKSGHGVKPPFCKAHIDKGSYTVERNDDAVYCKILLCNQRGCL